MSHTRFPYAGSTHCALRYACMKKAPVTAEDVHKMFPTKFDRLSRAESSMNKLSACGLLSPVDNAWKITSSGIDYLRVTAKAYKGEKK